MAAVSLEFKGGAALKRTLMRMQTGLGTAKSVSVGFLADKKYPPVHGIRGTARPPLHVAQVAFWNQYGTSSIPARPFFTTMIDEKSPKWGDSLAYLAKAHNYNAQKMLVNMGMGIQGQLVASINNWTDPPNSARWAKIKGFNKPLIDEGIMAKSVDYELSNRI